MEFPSRILCFFTMPDTNKLHALIHPCDYQDHQGDEKHRIRKMIQTNLCSRWQLASRKGKRMHGEGKVWNLPNLWCVEVENIDDNTLVWEEEPGVAETWQGSRNVWVVVDREDTWHELFPLPEPEKGNVRNCLADTTKHANLRTY